MAIYALRFWFEHGGGCLWAVNEAAAVKYDYWIDYELLPLSAALREKLAALEWEYHSYLDWDYPPDPSPWTQAHKDSFKRCADEVFMEL